MLSLRIKQLTTIFSYSTELIRIRQINFVFEFLEWESKDEDPADVNVWEDNWDDDTVEDDFSVQLR